MSKSNKIDISAKKQNPFVDMLIKKKEMIKHVQNGGKIEELKNKGFRFVTPV